MEHNIENYWKEYLILSDKKNTSKEAFSSHVKTVFQRSKNPFQFCLTCFTKHNSEELSKAKDNFLPFKIIKELCSFLAISANENKYAPLLTPSIQLDAYSLLKIIKITRPNLKYLVKCFYLDTNIDILLPFLTKDLKQSHSENIISFILILKCGEYFNFNDILIPLLLKNKISEINEFLESCPEYRISFMEILDKIIGNEIDISDLYLDYGVKKVNNNKGYITSKEIFKLATRLLKQYKFALHSFPHIMIRHNKSSLRFLFHKFYVEGGITKESLMLFAKELSEHNYELRKEVLNLFVDYFDYNYGFLYLKDLPIKENDIPHQLKNVSNINDHSFKHDSRNKNNFYQFNLPFQSIVFVDTIDKFKEAVNYLTLCDIIGLDSEWKPSLSFNEDEKFSLLQIASKEKVYLFDMVNLLSLLEESYWDKLGMLFSNKNIIKLSYSFLADKQKLSEFNRSLKEHVNRLTNMIDMDKIKSILLESYPNIFSYKTIELKGLSELVFMCFGKPLDKLEQFSVWTIRPLSKGQLIYAALDAFCLIEIYEYFDKKSIELNISDWKLVKPVFKAENKDKILNKKKLHSKNQSIYASSFQVVCDTMLQGLGKLLRYCNIDTVILNKDDSHDKCIEIYENKKRIILTKGNVYHRLRKYIPATYVYAVKAIVPKKQLEEIVAQFNVIITDWDIFARCAICNCNQYLNLEPSIFIKMKKYRSSTEPMESYNSKWVEVDGGRIDLVKGITNKNVKIDLDQVPYPVLKRVSVVYVCTECGKCYWDGSHLNKFLKEITGVIKNEEGAMKPVPVPPPP